MNMTRWVEMDNQMNPILINNSKLEEIKYKELYRVTEKFHSTMNTNTVLAEIIQTLKKVFPQYDYYLLLSNDYDTSANLPIKNLEYKSENAVAISAYMNASIELEESDYPIMYAPLNGKQGVYGVLQVKSYLMTPFESSQIDFIRLLANTAGSALENAKLFQQSQKLIEDLRLLDEISQKLISTKNIKEMFRYLYEQISHLIQSKRIGFIMMDEGVPKVLEGSSDCFHEPSFESMINTLLEKTNNFDDALFMAEVKDMPEYIQAQCSSFMSVPFCYNNSVKGLVIVLGDEPYSFSFEMFRLLQSLIQRSSIAVSNLLLREKLENMVITDHLTKLNSRDYMNERIEVSLKNDYEGTFILIDLDDFKVINDTYGHQIGDEVLIQVATIIKNNLRSTDIGSRWGGEELAVYLPNVPLEDGVKIAKRLLHLVSTETKPAITMSCGITHWVKGSETNFKDLFSQADAALYKAKNSGKNKIVVYNGATVEVCK